MTRAALIFAVIAVAVLLGGVYVGGLWGVLIRGGLTKDQCLREVAEDIKRSELTWRLNRPRCLDPLHAGETTCLPWPEPYPTCEGMP